MNTPKNRHITILSMRLLPLIFALALLVSCSDSKPEGIPADIVSSIESLRARTPGQNVADAESASGVTAVKKAGDTDRKSVV